MPALAYEKLLDEKRKRLTRRQSLFEDTHELSTRSLRLTRWPRCAVRDGRCVDTTMRFIPLEGLVMATRPGSVDPGLVPWLHQHAGVPLDDITDALNGDAASPAPAT